MGIVKRAAGERMRPPLAGANQGRIARGNDDKYYAKLRVKNYAKNRVKMMRKRIKNTKDLKLPE
jgi:hypothetical protein